MIEGVPIVSEEQLARTEELWRAVLVGEGPEMPIHRFRHLFGLLPADPRCRLCHVPFRGPGGMVTRVVLDRRPSQLTPYLCNVCEKIAARYQGGVELELSMLFADVRGSTTLAESLGTSEFSQLISRFYKVTTDILVRRDALIEKLSGDEVTGLFVPGFAGPEHARRAMRAATELLQATGHADRKGPWVPVGAGVHTGTSYVGSVGSKEGVTDLVALGDAVNTAARLASMAGPGEILVSEESIIAAGVDAEGLEQRQLELKGKSERVGVRVLRVKPG